MGAFGGVAEYLLNSTEEVSYNEVTSSIFIEPHVDRIDSEPSGFDLKFTILQDLKTQNRFLSDSHSPEFDLNILSESSPQLAIFCTLLI